METASQDLIREHDAILIALEVMEKMTEHVQHDAAPDHKDMEDLIEFLRVFAGKCHHGKEEDYLFPALKEAGVEEQQVPYGVIIEQHRQGRALVNQMQSSIAEKNIDKVSFVTAASSYIELLRFHIDKENTGLLPLADSVLPPLKQEELLINFEIFEKTEIGEDVHERMNGILNRFREIYL